MGGIEPDKSSCGDGLDAHRQHTPNQENAQKSGKDTEAIGAEGSGGHHADGIGADLGDPQSHGDEDRVGHQSP